jgi:hypothetical protein
VHRGSGGARTAVALDKTAAPPRQAQHLRHARDVIHQQMLSWMMRFRYDRHGTAARQRPGDGHLGRTGCGGNLWRAEAMVFMVIEHLRPGKAAEVYRRFRDRGRMAPDGVRTIASWVDLEFRRCFQVMEAADAASLQEWTIHWCDLVDFEIVAVRTSEQAAAAIAPEL